MKQTSTSTTKMVNKTSGIVSSMPRQSTLAMLRSFARTYVVDHRMQPGLREMVLN